MLKKYMFGTLLLAPVGTVAALALLISFQGQLGEETAPIVLDRTSSPSSSATPSATPSAQNQDPASQPATAPVTEHIAPT
ncbi:MAG: hypothetical protein SPI83_06280 [Rothia sp. (in: high G+C Gram-positive bacteria)]|nr:hypothetical protein [Rothia sp. (in: high G+C Gram-positive bacteria)]